VSTRSSARTIAVVTVVATLIVGFLLGVVADRVWLYRHGPRFGTHAQRFTTDRIVKRLDGELHFTDQQRAQVTQIIQARQQRIAVIQTGVRPQIRAEIDQANAEIDKILTPEQRTKFQQLKMRVHRPRNGE
jgi:Spy/CpxP family protein refolding chaperone